MDIYDDGSSQTQLDMPDLDGWGDEDDEDEDIEIDIKDSERILFLSSNKDNNLLIKSPNRVTMANRSNNLSSPTNNRMKLGSNELNHVNIDGDTTKDKPNNHDNNFVKIEPLVIDEPGNIAHSTRSVMYQSPNFQRFASDLGPSSATSILISLIMIVVIICITILPIVIHSQTNYNVDKANDLNNRITNTSQGYDLYQAEHADARCKCICEIPPIKLNPNHDSTDKNHTGSKITDGNSGNKSNNQDKMTSAQRSLYVGRSLPKHCNCRNIVGPHLKLQSESKLTEFCTLCECRYQNRNLNTIKRNVAFFMTILFSMSMFMLVQLLLKYLRITRRNLPPRLRWLIHQSNENN